MDREVDLVEDVCREGSPAAAPPFGLRARSPAVGLLFKRTSRKDLLTVVGDRQWYQRVTPQSSCMLFKMSSVKKGLDDDVDGHLHCRQGEVKSLRKKYSICGGEGIPRPPRWLFASPSLCRWFHAIPVIGVIALVCTCAAAHDVLQGVVGLDVLQRLHEAAKLRFSRLIRVKIWRK